ncbi:hypothetical protein VTO42DRAFT_809 [Malbranchea cinnamomea]
MERPNKRARLFQDIDVEEARRANDLRLKSRFEDIFRKYGRDFGSVGDEIDLRTGEIVVNNGHLQEMDNERDVSRGLWDDFHPDDDESTPENTLSNDAFSPGELIAGSPAENAKKSGSYIGINEHIDIEPIWKTPDIESRFTSAPKLASQAQNQSKRVRTSSPPDSGSIWALPRKGRRQRRKMRLQARQEQAKASTYQPRSDESPDSDDPLNDDPGSTSPTNTPPLKTTQWNGAHHKGLTSVTTSGDTNVESHIRLQRSIERRHEVKNMIARQTSPTRTHEQCGQNTQDVPTATKTQDMCSVVIHIDNHEQNSGKEARVVELDGTLITSASNRSGELIASEKVDLNAATDVTPVFENGEQENPAPTSGPTPKSSLTKNRSEQLSPSETKFIVDLRILQRLPWRKVLETAAMPRPSPRKLSRLYQAVDNVLTGSSLEKTPSWTLGEREILKSFISTSPVSWAEMKSSLPQKTAEEIQHEWIRLCLGDRKPRGSAELHSGTEPEYAGEGPSTPLETPNDASHPLSSTEIRTHLTAVDHSNSYPIPQDLESSRSESPDPLSAALENSWIGSGLSTMQIDTPPRRIRPKGNEETPLTGSLKLSSRRLSKKLR